jgi:peptide/nickel transport system permease protein
LIVSFFAFSVVRLVPGDVILLKIGNSGTVTDAQRVELERELGLDKPFYEQYWVWLSHALRGDLGRSIWLNDDVSRLVLDKLPLTMELIFLAMVFGTAFGLVVGIISALRPDTALDYAMRSVAVLGLSIPSFWLALMVILLPAVLVGWTVPAGYKSFTADPIQNLKVLATPSLVLGFGLASSIARVSRSSILEVTRQDYIRTAFSKGLLERTVVVRHILKNAMLPVITIMGLQFGYLLSGSVVIEQLFVLPGFGRMTYLSVVQHDFPLLQGCILAIATVFLILNIAVDTAYAYIDPRLSRR